MASSPDGAGPAVPEPRLANWVAGAGVFVASYDVAALSMALTRLQHLWRLDHVLLGVIGSAALIGMIAGGVAAGFLSDRYGRRLLLVTDFVTYGLGALGCALAPAWGWLAAFRILIGVGVGADFAVVFPYLTETNSARRRGPVMAWALWGANFGMLLAYAVSALTARAPDGWRIPLAGGALLVMPLLFLRRELPESRAWQQGRPIPLARRIALLWRGAGHAALWVSSVNWLTYQVSDQGLTVFLPLVLMDLFGATVAQAGWASVLIKGVTIPAALGTVWLVEHWGRRPLQVWGFLGRGLSLSLLGVLCLVDRPHFPPALWTAGLLVVAYAAGAMGPDKTIVITAAEQSHTAIRGTTQGIAEASGRLGGIMGVFGFSLLAGVWGAGAGLLLFGLMALIGWGISWRFLPETADRRAGVPVVSGGAVAG